MKYTWDCLLVKVLANPYEESFIYKARVLTQEGDVFDLPISRDLGKDKTFIEMKDKRINAQVTVVGAKFNAPVLSLTAYEVIA